MNRTSNISDYDSFLNGIVESLEYSRQQAFEATRKIITRHFPDVQISPELGFKDPTITQVLGFSDPFSGTTIKEQLLTQLEWLLVEPELDFTLVKPKKPARLAGKPFALDRVFYHRRLRCLVLVKLTLGKFRESYREQLHLYCNYASEHWTLPDENPPVGLILCSSKGEALARYALEGLPNKVMAAEYRVALPDEKLLVAEIEKTRHLLETQRIIKGHDRR
jgi:predicted nuclease of restriction endonuclease-like (RecB) superfamily